MAFPLLLAQTAHQFCTPPSADGIRKGWGKPISLAYLFFSLVLAKPFLGIFRQFGGVPIVSFFVYFSLRLQKVSPKVCVVPFFGSIYPILFSGAFVNNSLGFRCEFLFLRRVPEKLASCGRCSDCFQTSIETVVIIIF